MISLVPTLILRSNKRNPLTKNLISRQTQHTKPNQNLSIHGPMHIRMSNNLKLVTLPIPQNKREISSRHDGNPIPDFRVVRHEPDLSSLGETNTSSTLTMNSHDLEREIGVLSAISYRLTRRLRTPGIKLHKRVVEPHIFGSRSAITVSAIRGQGPGDDFREGFVMLARIAAVVRLHTLAELLTRLFQHDDDAVRGGEAVEWPIFEYEFRVRDFETKGGDLVEEEGICDHFLTAGRERERDALGVVVPAAR
jgi:hypothetical protein